MRTAGPVSLNGSSKQRNGVHVIIRLACIANAVYLTVLSVLSTQQAALLDDIGSPHGKLETSRRGKTAM